VCVDRRREIADRVNGHPVPLEWTNDKYKREVVVQGRRGKKISQEVFQAKIRVTRPGRCRELKTNNNEGGLV